MGHLRTREKEQLHTIYIVRALAILGVILVHVSSIPVGAVIDKHSSMYQLFNFVNVFNRFGTPTFIFLSAFVLFYSYYDRPMNKKMIGTFYKRRFLYILVPYFICTTYYFAIQMYYSYNQSWEQFFQNVAFSDFFTAVAMGKGFYHLYFVFISIQFYLLFPVLLWLLQRFKRVTKHLVWIGLVLQWAFVLFDFYYLHYPDKGHLATSYLSNYLLGAFFGIYYLSIKDWIRVTWRKLQTRWAVLWVPLWAIWIGASLGHVYLWYQTRANDVFAHGLVYEALWFLHSYSSALILLQVSDGLARILNYRWVNLLYHLGSASFGIYIIHAAVLFYYSLIPASFNPKLYYAYIAGGFVVTLTVSWGIVALVHRYMKHSWLLFGSMPKSKPHLPGKAVTFQGQSKTEAG
ncbi:acyltransferase [Paenibacillus sp. J2TS4]|uniref:acyltransferase n=1 Tax=Paenibacillus sp. J2TS4 TaxID=2807194 RepID=UPI001B14B2D2|nr:acyltransferase [Paenibacillus sp. J2TS4]GIP32763.1 hypothetical protein J2TS4_19730 [Paenibacillus sp. J2TS4]